MNDCGSWSPCVLIPLAHSSDKRLMSTSELTYLLKMHSTNSDAAERRVSNYHRPSSYDFDSSCCRVVVGFELMQENCTDSAQPSKSHSDSGVSELKHSLTGEHMASSLPPMDEWRMGSRVSIDQTLLEDEKCGMPIITRTLEIHTQEIGECNSGMSRLTADRFMYRLAGRSEPVAIPPRPASSHRCCSS